MSTRAVTDVERTWATTDARRRRQRARDRYQRLRAEHDRARDPVELMVLSIEVDEARQHLDRLAA